MPENDVQIDLKKRARRRLVGALALALVAAIVLPMIMDSEPRPGSDDLSIRIPSQDGSNIAAQILKGNAPPPESPEMPAERLAQQQAPSPSDMPPEHAEAKPLPEMPATQPAVESAPALKVPAEAPAMQASASSASSHSSSRSSASSASSRSSAHSQAKKGDDAQRARDILEGRSAPPAAPAASGSGHYSVQIGVFKDESNAREIAARAAAAGVHASVVKGADGKFRVRSGTVTDRAAADKLVDKLKKSGLPGFVSGK